MGTILSSTNQKDIVSMGTTAARKVEMILQNAQDVLADELLTACQVITKLHEALHQHVREKVDFYEIGSTARFGPTSVQSRA